MSLITKQATGANNTRKLYLSVPVAIAAIVLSLAFNPVLANGACTPNSPAPNIAATPQEVVKSVIDALRDNDKDNTGIATVFCFASPGNRSMTGPLESFTAMITNGYGVMLNHAYNYVEKMKIEDDTAMQAVWLIATDGKEYGFLFTMGKQSGGEFADMWMTEAVVPIERKGTQGLGI
ncbi:MAG: DUF4864 domain-containing protein [Granulosicoccaceae bacterium]